MVVRMATTLITTMSSISVKPRAARGVRVLQFDSFMGIPRGRSIGHAFTPVGLAALVEIRAYAQYLDAGEAGAAAGGVAGATIATATATGAAREQEGGVGRDAALPQILAPFVRGHRAVLVAVNRRRAGEHAHDVNAVRARANAGARIHRWRAIRRVGREDHLVVEGARGHQHFLTGRPARVRVQVQLPAGRTGGYRGLRRGRNVDELGSHGPTAEGIANQRQAIEIRLRPHTEGVVVADRGKAGVHRVVEGVPAVTGADGDVQEGRVSGLLFGRDVRRIVEAARIDGDMR